jgi:heme-degrading monooxygenase HmoA
MSMIVEVLRYQVKPGRRDEFIRFFEIRAMPARGPRWAESIG